MTLKEAIESGRPFKLPELNYWIKVENEEFETEVGKFIVKPKDLFRNDWKIKEKWYEGDFKKKWPKGVLCKVWDEAHNISMVARVRDYKADEDYPFIVAKGIYRFTHAEPVKPEEAPAIIGREE